MKVEFFRKVNNSEVRKAVFTADRFVIDGLRLLSEKQLSENHVQQEMVAWHTLAGGWVVNDDECDVVRISE